MKSLFGAVYRLHDSEPPHPFFVGVKLAASVTVLLVPTPIDSASHPAAFFFVRNPVQP